MKRNALMIILILGAALAVAPLAQAFVEESDGVTGGSAVVTNPVVLHTDVLGGDGTLAMSGAEYRALMIRGEALNHLYGNAVTRLSPEEFSALYRSGADRLSPQELAAVVARGEALDARYGNHITDLTPQQFKVAYESGVARAIHTSPVGAAQPTASSGSSFDWRYAVLGSFGAMLLAMASVAVTRRRHRLSF